MSPQMIPANLNYRAFLEQLVRRSRFRPSAPDWKEFELLATQGKMANRRQNAVVDVIIPVYRGCGDTFACILSVLRSKNTTPFDLIVIDDCSPEPWLSRDLEKLQQMDLITLIKNPSNLGFPASANLAMGLHADRDILLLNNDTLVFGNWLDRLRAHLHAGVSTVTPFTNNGTICSYPKFCADNPQELEIQFGRLDEIASSINRGLHVDIPTAVGFCMYVTRKSLADVGEFDQEVFQKGYGEENDFCMRASKRGWRHLHALDTFVFHSGETSFGRFASEGKRRGYAAVTRKHPEYERLIKDFVAKDPAREARVALDLGRQIGLPTVPTVLCINHTWGGGIQRYINDHAADLHDLGRELLVAVPVKPGSSVAQLSAPGGASRSRKLPRINFAADTEEVRPILRALGIEKIEVHSTATWSSTVVSSISRISRTCGIPYAVMLHDYISICPRITLINETGLYCGELGPEQCASCLSYRCKDTPSIHPDIAKQRPIDIHRWRLLYKNLFAGASEVYAPSKDTAVRIARYFNEVRIKVTPHNEPAKARSITSVSNRDNTTLRVAVIGAINKPKGLEVLCSCARDASKRKLPIEFVIVGHAYGEKNARRANIRITGRYRDSDIYDLLAEQNPQMVFLPSVWPETYSYTLSIAMAAELPIIAFDIGAQSERLLHYRRALLLPLNLAKCPNLINDAIFRFNFGGEGDI